MKPLALLSLLFYVEVFDYILVYGARRLLMLDRDSLILLDVMKVYLLHILSYHDSPLVRLIICGCGDTASVNFESQRKLRRKCGISPGITLNI